MAGIISIPTAAVVAGPEPEMAPKNTQARAVVTGRPPGMGPMMFSAMFTSLLDIPEASIRAPARMKEGRAIRGKEEREAAAIWMSMTGSLPTRK